MNKSIVIILSVVAVMTITQGIESQLVAPGNLVVSNNRMLYEYTSKGVLVREIGGVPYPGKGRNLIVADVVVERSGRLLHVLNTSAFDDNYLSSLDLATGQWSHAVVACEPSLMTMRDLSRISKKTHRCENNDGS